MSRIEVAILIVLVIILEDPMTTDFTSSARYRRAIQAFDDANGLDPNQESDGTTEVPRELLYARRLSDWVVRLKPDGSEGRCTWRLAANICVDGRSRALVIRPTDRATCAGAKTLSGCMPASPARSCNGSGMTRRPSRGFRI
jgi:hypothetical protein